MNTHHRPIWRFVLAAILTPVVSWIIGSAVPGSPVWLSFGGELAAMLAVVFVVSLLARGATGWAVATGLGLTFGLAAVIILLFGVRGVNACGGRGLSTSACPEAPVAEAILILIQVGCAIVAAFWLGARSGRNEMRRIAPFPIAGTESRTTREVATES